jgi:two-component system cell cycle sensor histidine kinase PleC
LKRPATNRPTGSWRPSCAAPAPAIGNGPPDQASIFLSEASSEMLDLEGMRTVSLGNFLNQVHPEHQARVREAIEKSREIGWLQVAFRCWQSRRSAGSRCAVRDLTPKMASCSAGSSWTFRTASRRKTGSRLPSGACAVALEGFSGPFALWDHRKRLLYWNRAFATDFGLTDTLRTGMTHETVTIARSGAIRAERQSADDNASRP